LERQIRENSSLVSHSQCWCNSSRKQDTNNGFRV
jgi:hypothetical protein